MIELVLGFVAALVTIVVAILTAWLTSKRELAQFKEEKKLDYSVETAIIHLLKNPSYKKRGFKKIKQRKRSCGKRRSSS